MSFISRVSPAAFDGSTVYPLHHDPVQDSVVSMSRCPLLLTRDLSALQSKGPFPRRSLWRGIHKGAVALLWGEPLASMRASVVCWRAACLRGGGNPPAPAFPGGETGKGDPSSWLPQAASALAVAAAFRLQIALPNGSKRPTTCGP